MRLLSLVHLASDESGKIPYTSIKDTLQVYKLRNPEIMVIFFFSFLLFCVFQLKGEEVEPWIVKAISAKLIDCKMDQMNQVVIVRQVASVET